MVFFKQQMTGWLQERPAKKTTHLLAELLIAQEEFAFDPILAFKY